MTAKRKATASASKKKTVKSKTRKASSKKTKRKVAAKATSTKKTKASTTKAKAAGRKVKKKSTKATKARTDAAPASRRTAVKSRRRSAPKAKRKAASKRTRQPSMDLGLFRSRLAEMQAEMFQAYMNAKGDSRNRESDGTEDYIDYAVNSYDREFLLSLTELEQNRLSLVNEALTRIDRGGFGLCTQCQRVIPVKRLEVQPWARYCVACQELADSGLVDDTIDFPSDDEEEEELEEEADEIEEVDLDATLDDDDTPDESQLSDV